MSLSVAKKKILFNETFFSNFYEPCKYKALKPTSTFITEHFNRTSVLIQKYRHNWSTIIAPKSKYHNHENHLFLTRRSREHVFSFQLIFVWFKIFITFFHNIFFLVFDVLTILFHILITKYLRLFQIHTCINE